MFNNLRADIKRYVGNSTSNSSLAKKILHLIFTQEFYPILVYRFGKWARKAHIPVLSRILLIIYFFLNKAMEIFVGIGIWLDSDIGKGLYLAHWGGIYIHAEIGENCTVAQQVIIGFIGGGKGGGTPRIGNNVYVGAGAKVLGHIKVGNNVRIGANAVVIKDVPDDATVVGVPARVVKIAEARKAEVQSFPSS